MFAIKAQWVMACSPYVPISKENLMFLGINRLIMTFNLFEQLKSFVYVCTVNRTSDYTLWTL
jgi:hypothetical protein